LAVTDQKILILDDNADYVDMLRELLSDNFNCETCTSANEAITKILADASYRLVISDYAMPEMSGSDFLRQLRAKGNMVPLIFLTGELNLELALNALRMGAIDLIEKPISPEELEKVISRALYIDKRRQAYYSAVAQGKPIEPDKILGLLFVNMAADGTKKKAG